MPQKPQKIAVFGGAFDPIHEGHVQLALAFAQRLGLDKVLLVPTYVPPHKLRENMAPAADRLEMCRRVAAAHPVLEVSDIEIARGGASFTVDTLETLAGQYTDVEWYLITGADMFLTLATWWRFEDIAELAILCAAPRGTVTIDELRAYARTLERQGAKCCVEDIPVLDVSSTAIRERLAAGRWVEAEELLPREVAAYIRERGLYAAGGRAETRTTDEQFIEIIRKRETPRRFHHSLCVADEAVRLAEKYGADPAKARTAGILHDIFKDAGKDAQLQIFRDFAILLDNVETQAPKLWHAIAGAAFIRHILHVEDEDILAAVRYHTTARAGMSPLEKVLYLADFTSADRDYPDVDEMRRLVDVGMEEAMAYALRYSIRDLIDKQAAIHPDTLAAYNELVMGHHGREQRHGEG